MPTWISWKGLVFWIQQSGKDYLVCLAMGYTLQRKHWLAESAEEIARILSVLIKGVWDNLWCQTISISCNATFLQVGMELSTSEVLGIEVQGECELQEVKFSVIEFRKGLTETCRVVAYCQEPHATS